MEKRLYFEMPEDDNPFPAVVVEFECSVCGRVEEAKAVHIPKTFLHVTKEEIINRSSCLSVLDVPKCSEHGCHMDPKKVIAFVLHLTETEREDGVCECNIELAQYGGKFDQSLVVKHKVNRAGGDMLSWGSELHPDRDGEGAMRIQGACPHCLVRDAAFFEAGHAKCRFCVEDMECQAFSDLNPRYVHDYVSLGGLGKIVRGHFVSKGFHHGVFEPEEGRIQDDRDVTLGMLEAAGQALRIAFDPEFPQFIMDSEEKLETLVKAVRSYLNLDEKDFKQEARARIIARIVGSIWNRHPEGVTVDSDPVWVFLNARMPYQSTDHRVDDDISVHRAQGTSHNEMSAPVRDGDVFVTPIGDDYGQLLEKSRRGAEMSDESVEPTPKQVELVRRAISFALAWEEVFFSVEKTREVNMRKEVAERFGYDERFFEEAVDLAFVVKAVESILRGYPENVTQESDPMEVARELRSVMREDSADA